MRTTSAAFSAKRIGRLITFSRGTAKTERRVLTIDIWAPPECQRDMQLWFIDIMGRIWWDVTDTESHTNTTRIADRMVDLTQRFRTELSQEGSAHAND